MVGKPILYETLTSPPVRAVKMLAKAINLDMELKPVDLFNKQHLSDEYLKKNPAHTVPTLDDNGVILCDSHAILMYLMDKYAKNDSLYPKDLVKRSQINQLLFMDGTFFTKLLLIVKPIVFGNVRKITETQKESVHDSYQTIERIVTGKDYVSGNEVSIADISMVATISAYSLIVPIDSKKYPCISQWVKRMELLPYYELNAIGNKAHEEILKKFLD